MSLNNDYIFILGRYPDLSKKEIFSILEKLKVKSETIATNDQVLVISTKQLLDINSLNKTLGGTVKIGRAVSSLPSPTSQNQLSDYFTSDALFIDILDDVTEKVTFGISYYSERGIEDKGMTYKLTTLTRLIKSHLEAQGFKVRYPKLEGTALSSASVGKNKLLTQGAEILLIQTKDALLVGKTLAVQEFESFSKRDYGRPNRDMDSGIMPPKIARMMINLTESNKDAKFLDPFCGSGTILQEALILGYSDVTGTDISEKAVADSKKNLTWLRQREPSLAEVDIRCVDVLKLEEVYEHESFDAVVGEPYMGPNYQERPLLSVMQKNRDELELFYPAALEVLAHILKPGGTIVMILPIFHSGNHYLHMDISAKINTLGLKQIPLSENKRQSITIGNNYDFVLREIIKFKKEPIPLSF